MQHHQRRQGFEPHINIFDRIGNSLSRGLSKLPNPSRLSRLPKVLESRAMGRLALGASPVILGYGARTVFSGVSSRNLGEVAFGALEMAASVPIFQHGILATGQDD